MTHLAGIRLKPDLVSCSKLNLCPRLFFLSVLTFFQKTWSPTSQQMRTPDGMLISEVRGLTINCDNGHGGGSWTFPQGDFSFRNWAKFRPTHNSKEDFFCAYAKCQDETVGQLMQCKNSTECMTLSPLIGTWWSYLKLQRIVKGMNRLGTLAYFAQIPKANHDTRPGDSGCRVSLITMETWRMMCCGWW